MPAPDLFIVGAPKCGTTALTRYLEAHPQVYMARRKDLHYYGSDLGLRHRPCPDLPAYLAHFAEAPPQARRIGDSSVWYLYSQRAAAEIAASSPSARAIILLRHPVEMMYALWAQLRLNSVHDEPLPTFAEALAAEPDRRAGRRVPPRTPLPEGLHYRRVASYAPQVARYFEALGRDRVRVLLQEELKADPAGVYRDLCAWLDIDPSFQPPLKEVNTSKAVRSEPLRRLLAAVPDPLKALLPADLRLQLRRQLRRWNTRHAPRQQLDPQLRAALVAELLPEVEALEALLGRPLANWKR